MSKLNYTFIPIPKYFWENGWFRDPLMHIFITWAFAESSPTTQKKFIDYKEIVLQPFQFIFKREEFAKLGYMTVQESRTRLNRLIEAGLLKKSANQSTNRFNTYTWVTEAFCENSNQPINQPLTNRQPTDNQPYIYKEKEYRIKIDKEKINKKETSEKVAIIVDPQSDNIYSDLPISEKNNSKIKFRENVLLTQQEFDKLLEKHNLQKLNLMLDILDSFKGSSGKKYKSDFFTMKEGGWVLNEVEKRMNNSKIIPYANNQEKAKEISEEYEPISKYYEFSFMKDGKGIAFVPLLGGDNKYLAFSENGFEDRLRQFFEKMEFKKISKISQK